MPPPTTWQSCCLTIDPRATVYFTQMIIGLAVLVFAGVQLVRLRSCPEQQAYLALFTFVIGLLLPSPGIGPKATKPPVYSATPIAELEGP